MSFRDVLMMLLLPIAVSACGKAGDSASSTAPPPAPIASQPATATQPAEGNGELGNTPASASPNGQTAGSETPDDAGQPQGSPPADKP